MSILAVYINLSQGKEVAQEDLKKLGISSDQMKLLKSEVEKKEEPEVGNEKLKKALESLKIPSKDFNIADYQKLLAITKLAFARERNGVPEEHAVKLLYTFGSFDAAISYLKRFETANPTRAQLIHDACLFACPAEEINLKLWQGLAQKYMPDEQFEKVFGLAPKIENYVNENRKLLEESIRTQIMRRHELRLGNEWDKMNAQKESIPSLQNYIQSRLKTQEGKIKKAIDKMFSSLAHKALKEKGKLPTDKKEIAEIIRKYETTEEGQKLRREIETKIRREWEQRFKEEYSALASANAEKQKYIEEHLKKDAAIIEGNCQDAIRRILSENTSLETLQDYLAHCCYKNAKQHPTAAALFFEYGIPEIQFDKYLNLKPSETSIIPDLFIDGDKIGYPGFYLRKLSSKDPKAAILGKLTSCCQWMGGQGGECAVHGITSPEGGFYVICQKKDKIPSDADPILSQCWVWQGETNRIVFDSIESQINFREINKVPIPENCQLISDFFILAAHQIIEKGFSQVLLGAGASPDDLIELNVQNPESPKDYQGYRDSRNTQAVLAGKNPLFIQYYLSRHPGSNLKKILGDLRKPTETEILEWAELCAIYKRIDLLKIIPTKDSTIELEQMMKEHYDLTQRYLKAISEKDIKSAMEIIHKGIININVSVGKDYDKITIFPLALEKADLESLKYLIEKKGLDVNMIDDRGRNALQLAAGDVNYNFTTKNYDVSGNFEVFKYLIESKGLDVNKLDKNGNTLLHLATKAGNLDIVKYLIEQKGMDINIVDLEGGNLLHSAIHFRRWDIVKYMIARGVDLENTGSDGITPLMSVAQAENFELLKTLVEKGVDVNKTDSKGRTVLDVLDRSSYRNSKQNMEMIEFLIDHGADVNKARNVVQNIFHELVRHGKMEEVKYFIEKITDIDQANNSGETALNIALSQYYSDMTKYLIEKGADINKVDNSGKNALHHAALNNNFEMVKYLVEEKGMDVNKVDNQGKTIIDLLVSQALKGDRVNRDMMRYLSNQSEKLRRENKEKDKPKPGSTEPKPAAGKALTRMYETKIQQQVKDKDTQPQIPPHKKH